MTYPLPIALLLIILLTLSCIAFTIFIERLLYFRKQRCDYEELLPQLQEELELKDYRAALALLEATDTAIGRVLREGIYRLGQQKSRLARSMKTQGKIEIAQCERRVSVLSWIAQIAPLLGLLGTWISFSDLLTAMHSSGHFDILREASFRNLQMAFFTTSCGMAVAIPSYIGYNLVVKKIEHLSLEISVAAERLFEFIEDQDVG